MSKEAASFGASWKVEVMAPGNGLDMGIEAEGVIQGIPGFLAWSVVVEVGVPSSETGNLEKEQVCIGG